MEKSKGAEEVQGRQYERSRGKTEEGEEKIRQLYDNKEDQRIRKRSGTLGRGKGNRKELIILNKTIMHKERGKEREGFAWHLLEPCHE